MMWILQMKRTTQISVFYTQQHHFPSLPFSHCLTDPTTQRLSERGRRWIAGFCLSGLHMICLSCLYYNVLGVLYRIFHIYMPQMLYQLKNSTIYINSTKYAFELN